MLKLYFGSVFSTISTLLATVFVVFLALVAPRRDSITHWGTLVLVLFFLGLAMSIMSGMRDGIGTAAISPVLSSRVAVQVKRYDPQGKPVGREVVALFQRDAQTKGAERAILVTLGKFSEPARRAAIVASPTVDLIDGERLAELVKEQRIGVRTITKIDPEWFDRFD